MFATAASETFQSLKKAAATRLLNAHPFRAAYLQYVIGIKAEAADNQKSQKKKLGKPADKTIDELIEEKLLMPEGPLGGKYAKDRTLVFLWKLSTDKSRLILDDLIRRNYYKRVIEIPLSELSERGWMNLSNRITKNRNELQANIDALLVNTLITAIQDQMKVRESLIEDDVLRTVTRIISEKFAFIIDLPLRGWTAEGQDPIFVSDYKRRYFRATIGLHQEGGSETLWSDMGHMMRRIAVFRVFCEPDLHQLVTRVLQPTAILRALSELMPELRK